MNKVYFGDNSVLLQRMLKNKELVDLIYIDPPFNTQKKQKRETKEFHRNNLGTKGFGGQFYVSTVTGELSYRDGESNYVDWLCQRLVLAKELLKPTGSIFVHLDYREVHYIKVAMDNIFGRDNFVNEIVWLWDYGAKQKNKWPTKHNNILFYSKSSEYYFDLDNVENRIPYMTPGLVTPEQVEQGKIVTDGWWLSIVGTNSKEKTGYPTQKPEKLLTRIIETACPKDGMVLDFFAGSGTTGAVADKLGRQFILCDNNPAARGVMKERLSEQTQFIELGEK